MRSFYEKSRDTDVKFMLSIGNDLDILNGGCPYIYINWLDGNQQKIVVDSQKHGRDHHTREDLIRKNKVVFILPATTGCKPGIS